MKFEWKLIDETPRQKLVRYVYIICENEVYLEYYDPITFEIIRRFKKANFGHIQEIRYRIKVKDIERIEKEGLGHYDHPYYPKEFSLTYWGETKAKIIQGERARQLTL